MNASARAVTTACCADDEPFTPLGLVGSSVAMQLLRAEVRLYAPRTATVMIRGETGSGKELVARALHRLSLRASAPFVAVNVATLRRDLAASELFGHERGAFTGAVTRRRGVFEQAHDGTLFLDEIGELDLAVQGDLLRVLETGEVRSLGSERVRPVSVRVITATHQDLFAKVVQGQFRADLYYRLHVLPVAVPPLRARREDLAVLAEHLLTRLQSEVGTRVLTADALALLTRYGWPGNVRQFVNVLRRVAARTPSPTLSADAVLDALGHEPEAPLQGDPERAPRDLPACVIDEALRASQGSVASAARRLGVPRSTLRYRLRPRLDRPLPVSGL